jgi:choline dehydrogenase-like flavoprotein
MGTDGGFDHDVIVIGTGFGGTMTALTLAREFKRRRQGEDVLMLERGTWWTTPVETVADKTLAARNLLESNGQPVQFWSSAEHFKGFVDIFTRCLRRKGNEDGLYELTTFGRRGLFGALSKNDGVSILRASGVGGGSLVYANVTIRPPDFVLDDRRWPLGWSSQERDGFYARARDAIGHGALWALDRHYDGAPDYPPVPDADKGPSVNTGLSRIATRTAGIKAQYADGVNGAKRIDLTHSKGLGIPPRQEGVDSWNALWIDRARVFQTAMSELTPDYGTCESSINDVDPDAGPHVNKDGQPQNYCERQGRCIIGCLPGARHTLNKQLMKAIYAPAGKPPAPLHGVLNVEALCEVRTIAARPGGGYEVRYLQRDPHNPKHASERVVTAGRVVVAAGTVGTNEILLRCRQAGTLPGLSAAVGKGFSTNGDSLQFLEGCTERLSLTRGPVTTSFAHFAEDPERFHTIEDNGIPRALAALAGHGVPLVRSLSKGRHPKLFVLFAMVRYVLGRIPAAIRAVLRNAGARQPEFASEDEQLSNMMCVATMGREASIAEFRLGKGRDTTLRLARPDGKEFRDDPIYQAIDQSLERFAGRLTDRPSAKFINPFTAEAQKALGTRSITLSHPLGGCRMAASATGGVVDEHGRVFDTTKPGEGAVHDGLYVADGSIIPTALGVNPSLTISALALRVADRIVNELPHVAAEPPVPAPEVVTPTP